MRPTRFPIVMIFSICIIWNIPGCHSNGRSNNWDNDIDICSEKHICGKYGVCQRMPNHYACVCSGKKTSVEPKPCLDGCDKKYTCGNTTECDLRLIGHVCICKENERLGNTQDCIRLPCLSEQMHIKDHECDKDDDIQNEETTNNPYCSFLTFASGINKNCQNYKNSNISQNSLLDIAEFVSNMSHRESEWFDMNSNQRLKTVTLLFSLLESTVILTVMKLNTTDYKMATTNMDVQIQILQTTDGATTLSDDGDEMDFQWKKYSHDFAAVSFITCSKMEMLVGDSGLEMSNKKYGTEYLQLNSKVLIATVTSSKQTQQIITFTIMNKEVDDVDDYTVCVYWNTHINAWSTSGCFKLLSNESHTLCRCTHISSFAVLVALYKVEGPGLTTITYLGIITSLVCLAIAIVTFTMCRAIHSTRTTIHTHLCLCLFMAQLLFLIGISATTNKAVCAAVAGILHYFFLACFLWMFLEGIQLYLMVVKVFWVQSLRGKYTQPIAYGIPALIVIISAATNPSGYGTREYCWLSMEKGFRWSFVGTLCAICLSNLVFLILTIWRLAQKFHTINPDLSNLQKLRMFVVTALAQLVLLGCTWIIGVFHFQARTIALAYIFTIVNSFQGTFIFLLHCVKCKQVRDEYRKWISSFFTMLKITKYAPFSESSQPTSVTQGATKSESSL
ncbi:adhesion G protein-coupled receptor E3-like [Hemiscyllium ocellatum]|uniref:adhesion G protein-coupled receptor E3-like n=1 Tax=Hemiscyllium ocellatum TaxID=170820 RepID=UPI00296648D5|nr:adhesion G protein-coupled receptor E3-like [Hemiscyllium ocellatum]